MFFQVQWKAVQASERKSRRVRTPYGTADLWTESTQTAGELAVLFKFEGPRVHTAPGLLLSISELILPLSGTDAVLRLTPIPKEWRGAPVGPFFEQAGFEIRLSEYTIELHSELSPNEAIERAALIFFALDLFSRNRRELFVRARQVAARQAVGEGVLELLDERHGANVLRKVVGRSRVIEDTSERDQAIIAALRKIGTKSVVHFDCDGGGLLRLITREFGLERAVGVEASLKRVGREVTGWELHHGSVVEPPDNLPSDSTALLVQALPPLGDLRRSRAAEMLFRNIGFDWVLCLENDSAFVQWAEDTAKEFGYRVATWMISGDHAVLFRRMPDSCPRAEVHRRSRFSIAPRIGPVVEVDSLAGSLEAFSRLTVDPRWLIYIPPESASLQNERTDGDLEHPKFVFDYYRVQWISELVMEQRELGSAAVAVICRDEKAGRRRFGIPALGCLYSRAGKALFDDQTRMLGEIRDGLTRANFWSEFQTDWVCLEGTILPWGVKAKGLIDGHGEVLRAGEAMYEDAASALERFGAKEELMAGRECFRRYRVLYEKYSQESRSATFAPYHLIATEGRSYFEETRLWHLETLAEICRRAGAPFEEVQYRLLNIDNPADVEVAISWWKESAAVVFKTLPFAPRGKRGSAQPGYLCRNSEHLRLAYGPLYDMLENRIWISEQPAITKRRNKSRRVVWEQALAIEAVERFLAGAPFEMVEECIRAVSTIAEGESEQSCPVR